MKKSLKNLIVASLAVLSLTLVGCGDDKVDDKVDDVPPVVEDNNGEKTAMTKEQYGTYLNERYDYYFDNDAMGLDYDMYDIYDDDFDYTGTYDEFITGYNDFYAKDRENLEAFKADLENNYVKGDPEVDKYHDELMTSLDEAILSSDNYTKDFSEKTKDYGTYAKDEVVKGLRDIGRVPYEARTSFDEMVDNFKDRMGID